VPRALAGIALETERGRGICAIGDAVNRGGELFASVPMRRLAAMAARRACGFIGTQASCDCDAPYVWASESDRAIAADMGVNAETVRRARKQSGAANAAPAKRPRKDGKSYRRRRRAWSRATPGRRRR
jgi:hypothetical protein